MPEREPWKGRCRQRRRPFSHLALALAALTISGAAPARHPPRPVPIIWDDDCGSDLDCVSSLDALHRQAEAGHATLLALIADSSNPAAAPVMAAWNGLWRHDVPIGAFRGTMAPQRTASRWSQAVRDALRPGDAGDRYPDCVTVYRRALAGARVRSVRIVETGFPTCLAALLRSPADAISPLPGPALIRARVDALFVMGGDYPGPTREYNFQSDTADNHALFKLWVRQAGFPPIYLNGFGPGSRVTLPIHQPGSPAAAAAAIAERAAGETARPAWDLISIHQAIAGLDDYVASPGGTNVVAEGTGRNIWSRAPNSGHVVLTDGRAGVDLHQALASFLTDGPSRR